LSQKQETEIKLFGKWSFKGIEIEDPGLKRYISLRPVAVPHSMGRHEHKRFRKANVNIVERLLNNLMRPGKNAGKKAKVINILRHALEIIYLRTGRNPVEVLARAVENSAPCEDTTRLSYGGIVYHLSVDISPQRRVDLALRLLLAANHDMKSYAVAKRHEKERIAKSSR